MNQIYGIHCCLNCNTRKLRCHSTCKRYKEEKERMEKIKQQIEIEKIKSEFIGKN